MTDFDHPRDPANGRYLCSPEHPMPADRPKGSRWSHTNIEEGEQQNGWPCGDTVRCRCLDCGTEWTMELPQ